MLGPKFNDDRKQFKITNEKHRDCEMKTSWRLFTCTSAFAPKVTYHRYVQLFGRLRYSSLVHRGIAILQYVMQ